jgi:hypothetical protein
MSIPLRHKVLPVASDSVLGDGVISRGRTLEAPDNIVQRAPVERAGELAGSKGGSRAPHSAARADNHLVGVGKRNDLTLGFGHQPDLGAGQPFWAAFR